MKKTTYYKFINFELIEEKPKTNIWSCRNNNSCAELGVVNNNSSAELGVVKWYPAWRRYCYFPTVQAVYSSGCLEDINKFIKHAENQRKSVAENNL